MSEVVIKVENLSKKYFRKKNLNSYSPLAESQSEYFWALKDINFSINQGEIIGIIGRNGAGKSTLLKILSRITAPTEGLIKIKGKLSSLLEVGTGFHPSLSGRENIFLNGAILGMKRAEVNRKLAEIIDFSGVEQFIDTPVKYYSSGMYVRLAFAVAAHLTSDILLIDEVLAVGDLIFQKKCLGKIEEVSNSGRTILFISHNLSTIQHLCKRGILLEKGQLFFDSDINKVLINYINTVQQIDTVFKVDDDLKQQSIGLGFVEKIEILNIFNESYNNFECGKSWKIRVYFTLNKNLEHFLIALGMFNSKQTPIRTVWSFPQNLNKGSYIADFQEDDIWLSADLYHISIGLSQYENTFYYQENLAVLHITEVKQANLPENIIRIQKSGIILNPSKINIQAI